MISLAIYRKFLVKGMDDWIDFPTKTLLHFKLTVLLKW